MVVVALVVTLILAYCFKTLIGRFETGKGYHAAKESKVNNYLILLSKERTTSHDIGLNSGDSIDMDDRHTVLTDETAKTGIEIDVKLTQKRRLR